MLSQQTSTRIMKLLKLILFVKFHVITARYVRSAQPQHHAQLYSAPAWSSNRYLLTRAYL